MKMIPEEKLRQLCSAIQGKWSLYVRIPETGELLEINTGERMVSASTIKIPLLALLLKDAAEGRVDLEQTMPMEPVNRVGGSGILQSLNAALELSLFDYAELMMVLSDNVATNVIIDVVGMERANEFFVQQGWTATHLGRKMMTPGRLLPDGTREQNYTSAADLADMMEKILAGTMVSGQISRTMMRIMAGQRNGKFRAALPEAKRYDPRKELDLPPEGKVVLVAKSGTLFDPVVANDAGILLLPDGRSAVMTMMTASLSNPETEEIMGSVARTVYEALRETK